MKLKLILFLIVFSYLSTAQKINKKLLGTWLCYQVTDSIGNKSKGKYGFSGDYIRFDFKPEKYAVYYSPYDSYSYYLDYLLSKKDSSIDLFPLAVYKMEEQLMKIQQLDENNLVFKSQNRENKLRLYYFKKQNYQINNLNKKLFFDFDTITIRHLWLIKKRNSTLKIDNLKASHESAYIIHSKDSFLFPIPQFISESTTFDHYVSRKFNFPENITPPFLSEEVIIEFSVTKNGTEDIKIIKGIGEEIDNQIINIMNLCKSKWKAPSYNDKIIESINRIHFVFYYGNISLEPSN